MKMDYYDYEYFVLFVLQDELKIESIEKDSKIYDAMATVRNDVGKLENQVVKRISTGYTITFNFTKDFHYCFDTKILKEAYEQEVSPVKTAKYLKKDITDSFVREFLLR